MYIGEKKYTRVNNTLQFQLKQRLVPNSDYTLVATVTTEVGNVTSYHQIGTCSGLKKPRQNLHMYFIDCIVLKQPYRRVIHT